MSNYKVVYKTNQPSETDRFRRVSVSCIKKVFKDDKQIPNSWIQKDIPPIVLERYCRQFEKLFLKQEHSTYKQEHVYTKQQIVDSVNSVDRQLYHFQLVDYEVGEDGQYIAIELQIDENNQQEIENE